MPRALRNPKRSRPELPPNSKRFASVLRRGQKGVLLCAALFAFGSTAIAKDVVAIVDIANPGNQVTALSAYFADDISMKLSSNPDVSIVERGQLNKILAEQGLQVTGAFDEKTIAKIGSLCGANHVLFGKYYPIGDDFEIITKTVDVTTGKVVKVEKSKTQRTESLVKLDAVVSSATTPKASSTPIASENQNGPIRLSTCQMAISTVFCKGEIQSPEGGKVQVVNEESVAYFDNGTKGKFLGGLRIAGTFDETVYPKVKQTVSFEIAPASINSSGAIAAFTAFKMVYKFNGQTFTIEQAPNFK
jgi:hypothetical protein